MEKGTGKSDKFLWIGNDPSIDFINTEIVVDGSPIDLLQSPEDYLEWLERAGIALRPIGAVRRIEKHGFQQAKDFRSFLRVAFERLTNGAELPQQILKATNAFISHQASTAELEVRGTKFELRPYWPVGQPADYVAPLAWAFAEFLAEADLKRLRKCKNPDCVLFFYDTSKSGTRTWCSLDICGNKMRMAASRERRMT